MSRFVDKLPFFDRRSPPPMEEAEDIARNGLLGHQSPPSGTLGELLEHVGENTHSSPPHQVLELGDMGSPPGGVHLSPRPLRFVLSFTDLTYSVKNPRKLSFFPSFFRRNHFATDMVTAGEGPEAFSRTKTLLDSISGETREGEILAVLGASGSGNSTLIDALANRIARESLKGSITLNGKNLEGRLLKAISAYVMQDDLLFPMLMVEEMLMFSAEFRLLRTLTVDKKRARVQALIDQLGLRQAANTIIGNEGHCGVSGGELTPPLEDALLLEQAMVPTRSLVLKILAASAALAAAALFLVDLAARTNGGYDGCDVFPSEALAPLSNSTDLDAAFRELIASNWVSPSGRTLCIGPGSGAAAAIVRRLGFRTANIAAPATACCGLPFAEASFDFIFSSVLDRARVLARVVLEMERVLRQRKRRTERDIIS